MYIRNTVFSNLPEAALLIPLSQYPGVWEVKKATSKTKQKSKYLPLFSSSELPSADLRAKGTASVRELTRLASPGPHLGRAGSAPRSHCVSQHRPRGVHKAARASGPDTERRAETNPRPGPGAQGLGSQPASLTFPNPRVLQRWPAPPATSPARTPLPSPTPPPFPSPPAPSDYLHREACSQAVTVSGLSSAHPLAANFHPKPPGPAGLETQALQAARVRCARKQRVTRGAGP